MASGLLPDVLFAFAKASAQRKQEQAEIRALEIQKNQQKIAADEQSLRSIDKLKDVLAYQNALGASRGIQSSSPTLQAITLSSFDEFAKDQKGRDLTSEFTQDAFDQQEANVKQKLKISNIENLFDFASKAGEDASAGFIKSLTGGL